MEEIAWEELLKHPKRFAIVAAFFGIGYLVHLIIPSDCEKEVSRWQSLYYAERKGKDSVQSSKDILYEQLLHEKSIIARHMKRDSATDSLLARVGRKSEKLLKIKKR